MEIAFSEKISPQLSAALLSTPYELGKEGGLSSGYLPESDSWEVIVKYVGDIEKIKEKYHATLTEYPMVREVSFCTHHEAARKLCGARN